jgi:hypothetical protein
MQLVLSPPSRFARLHQLGRQQVASPFLPNPLLLVGLIFDDVPPEFYLFTTGFFFGSTGWEA